MHHSEGPEADFPDLAKWRRVERERLIALRLSVSAADRERACAQLLPALDSVLGRKSDRIISFYWPFRGEFDLRAWAVERIAAGEQVALPVVVEKKQPMIFRLWRPGCRMERGIWNIPVPADGLEVIPDAVIAPLVGFDDAAYRLGYGGGYFDRTLASLPVRPLVAGIGLSALKLETIRPQAWDVPMDVIVTEEGVAARRS